MKNIINELQKEVDEATSQFTSIHKTSWGDQIGILLSVSHVQEIIRKCKEIETSKEEMMNRVWDAAYHKFKADAIGKGDAWLGKQDSINKILNSVENEEKKSSGPTNLHGGYWPL